MKKVFKVLAAVFAASVLSGFAGCKTESEDESAESAWSNELIKITGGTITGTEYINNFTGVFPKGRTVTLSDFYMSEYEITQAEYKTVMQNQKVTINGTTYTLVAEPSACTEANKSTYGVDFGTDYGKRPVECVTWYDAVYYCNARSKKENLTPAYNITVKTLNSNNHITAADVTLVDNANGYRLPTEAEWEYAARGGDPDAEDWNYVFSGADTAIGISYKSDINTGLDTVGWYCYNNKTGETTDTFQAKSTDGKGTHEVGKKAANRLGLYDMSGNVWEWCYDWYGNISSKTEIDPVGPTSGNYRVIRGNSWKWAGAYHCSVSYRRIELSKSIYEDIGFRVVRSAK